MRILGFQKTTLLDYPHKLAATIFLGGCNLRCPFCHNAKLVTDTSSANFSESEILTYLKKRLGILEGVCITGGEPTLSKDLISFLHNIKELGFLVKLDTNGTNPDLVSDLIHRKLIDYIAMDIKNCPSKYESTVGCPLSMDAIHQSIQLLMESPIDYEFRTTVVRELHTMDDLIEIGQWISGARQYHLQKFVDSGNLLCPNQFTSYTDGEMIAFRDSLREFLPFVSLRGVNQPI